MSTADLSSITSALAQLYQDQLFPQMNRAVVLSRVLPYMPGSGKNVAWDIETGTAAGSGVLAEGSDVSTYNDDTVLPAVLNWGDYSEAFQVTGKAMAAATSAGNPAELASLFLEKMERAVRRMAKKINQHFYTGDGAASTIMGLLDATKGAIMDVGSYAGIDRSTYPQWAGNVLANSGTPRALTFDLMRDTRKAIYIASGEMPDLIVCSPATHEAYGKLFKEQRRYVQDIFLRGQKISLDGGYQALEFDGIPVIADVDCPDNKMLFLNTNHLRIRQLPDVANASNRSPGMIQLHGTAEEQYGAGLTSLSARINPLAVSGDSFKVQLICYPQLQCTRPNANAVLADLTP